MNASVFRRTLARTWWLPIVAAALALAIQAARMVQRPITYIAVANVIVAPEIDPASRMEGLLFEHYRAQIELIKSDRLHANALTRVRGAYPSLKECHVEVEVAQKKGSSILNITAIGAEQEFTRVYLDALLDEYMMLRKQIDEATGKIATRKGEWVPILIMDRPAAAVPVQHGLPGTLVLTSLAGFAVGLALMVVVALIAGFVVPEIIRTPPPVG